MAAVSLLHRYLRPLSVDLTQSALKLWGTVWLTLRGGGGPSLHPNTPLTCSDPDSRGLSRHDAGPFSGASTSTWAGLHSPVSRPLSGVHAALVLRKLAGEMDMHALSLSLTLPDLPLLWPWCYTGWGEAARLSLSLGPHDLSPHEVPLNDTPTTSPPSPLLHSVLAPTEDRVGLKACWWLSDGWANWCEVEAIFCQEGLQKTSTSTARWL